MPTNYIEITNKVYALISDTLLVNIHQMQPAFKTQTEELQKQLPDIMQYMDAATELVNRQSKEVRQYVKEIFEKELPAILPEAQLWFKNSNRPVSDFVWVISPYEYHVMGQAVINIAPQQGEAIKMGILVNLSTSEIVTGTEGEGCCMYDTVFEIDAAKLPEANNSMAFLLQAPAIERGFGTEPGADDMAAFQQQYGYPFRTNTVAENVAYYLGRIAMGKEDFVMGFGAAYHDIAAGICLVEQAGGMVTDFNGGRDGLYTGESFFASGKEIHAQFMELKKIKRQ